MVEILSRLVVSKTSFVEEDSLRMFDVASYKGTAVNRRVFFVKFELHSWLAVNLWLFNIVISTYHRTCINNTLVFPLAYCFSKVWRIVTYKLLF
jgi:hypothetical protein